MGSRFQLNQPDFATVSISQSGRRCSSQLSFHWDIAATLLHLNHMSRLHLGCLTRLTAAPPTQLPILHIKQGRANEKICCIVSARDVGFTSTFTEDKP